MRRYSTPRITFSTDTDLTRWPLVVLTLEDSVGNQVHIDSNSEQMEITPTQVAVVLAQEQTGWLHSGVIHLQLDAVDTGNNRLQSNIMEGWLDDNLLGGVIRVGV